MSYPIRPISEDEWQAFGDVLAEGFNWTPNPQQQERYKAGTEFDRTLAAFDGDTIAGVTGIHSFAMTVPGGPIPVAGVTAVSVLPSHRRRGILSSLMRRQLADVRDRGEAVAALYASEAGIYGRFGYGRASDDLSFTIAKANSAFVKNAPVDPALRLRVAKPADVRGELEALFASVLAERPGRYTRSSHMWDGVLADEEFDQQGNGNLRSILAEDSSGVRGYALFRIKPSWNENGIPDGVLWLHELYTADPAAYALLWRSVLERDLVSTVRTWGRPVDDPIIHLLAEPRQLKARWADELWVRLVEVGKALESRSYAVPVDIVIEVLDDVCPWNAGRWRLTADASGASCKATDEEPSVTLPVSALGAVYLGGGSLGGLQGAGLLTEHTPGAVRSLGAAMSWDPKPWAGLTF
ncbi:GNAT family N-acetyltransferase [Nonomuraea sp. NPDC050556]|uniref:GNAT family N-acetyltransferase n=1 Tax=Nonomuraea sp. NPDC050556 TaxID=3364369 RepID=UPI0037B03C36